MLHGLIVREPFATMIVKGIKTWELRRKSTKIRGKIAIISKENIIGFVRLVRVRGPYPIDYLMNYYEYHRAGIEVLEKISGGKPLYVWELKDPIELKKPIKIRRKKGQVIWVRIEENDLLVNIPRGHFL